MLEQAEEEVGYRERDDIDRVFDVGTGQSTGVLGLFEEGTMNVLGNLRDQILERQGFMSTGSEPEGRIAGEQPDEVRSIPQQPLALEDEKKGVKRKEPEPDSEGGSKRRSQGGRRLGRMK